MIFTADQLDFDYDFTFTPGEPASRDYPGSGPEVDITTVRLNGIEIPINALTAEHYQQMVEQVIEHYG